MRSSTELVARLGSLLLSKPAVSFYLNGGPGSGKSYLLETLVEQIPSEISGAFVIGPTKVTQANIENLAVSQMQTCLEASFIESLPSQGIMKNTASAWRWFGEHAEIPSRQIFIVLVDLDAALDLPSVANLLSNARYLEQAWSASGAYILYLIAGSWDTVALAAYCERVGLSFPYTEGHNYRIWEGVDSDTMIALAQRANPKSMSVHGRVLFELSNGNPALALEMLEEIDGNSLSIKKLLDTTYTVAKSGLMEHRWLAQWAKLLPKGQEIVRQLLYKRYVMDPGSRPYVDQLLTLGIVKRREVGEQRYLGFSSWYMEMLCRLHSEAIGIVDKALKKVEIQEMSPPIIAANVEAYCIIHDVENNVRDFVTIQLCMHKEGGEHILKNRNLKYVRETGDFEDAYERLLYWRDKSESAGLAQGLNPLLSYSSTRDLADLIEEIGREMNSETWQRITKALRELANVRDVVMHNQLIDDKQLVQLYKLQASVYAALTDHSSTS